MINSKRGAPKNSVRKHIKTKTFDIPDVPNVPYRRSEGQQNAVLLGQHILTNLTYAYPENAMRENEIQ